MSWHLKAALSTGANPVSNESLPLAHLGLWNSFIIKLRATKNELVFGCMLRLPGELVNPPRPRHFNCGDYVKSLAQHMGTLHTNPSPD